MLIPEAKDQDPSKDMVIVRLTDYEGSPSTISKTQTQKAIRVIFDSIES